MAEEISIREKTTEPIVMQVQADGNIVDLTGVHHIEMHMIDSKGVVYRYSSLDTSPAIVITAATSGQVTYTPPSSSIFKYIKSPYKLYIKVYDTSVENYTAPESGEENIIVVRKEF